MKTWHQVLVVLVMAAAAVSMLITANHAPANTDNSSGRLLVVASFYPVYDFTRNVGGDRVDVKLLIPAGSEPHGYEPKPSDIKILDTARLLILNGVAEDIWAPKLVAGLSNKNLTVVDTSEGLQLITSHDYHDTEDDHHAAEDHHHATGEDPHIWLNPVLAQKQVAAIRDALIRADPAGTDYYTENAASYMGKLATLDSQFRSTMLTCKNKDIIITHATLAYFCQEYGCKQISVEGVNAEGEPTPQVMAAIVRQAKESNITVVFIEAMYSPHVAQAIANDINGRVAVFNTIHGLTAEEQARGENYLTQMQENVAIIKSNLDCG